ncbi:MAG TPA: hypothetical protein VEB20_19685 [Azospirillaceae bacterium]|nr:hypothetical protein [Azospirillaceae bacterium]
MTQIITSQHFLSDEIVEAKSAARDFRVLVSPVFQVEGEEFRVILDGNHSFAAALAAGVEPELVEATATDHDAIGHLTSGNVERFLEEMADDLGYIDAATRHFVW